MKQEMDHLAHWLIVKILLKMFTNALSSMDMFIFDWNFFVCVSNDILDGISALIQVVAWNGGDGLTLHEPMMVKSPDYSDPGCPAVREKSGKFQTWQKSGKSQGILLKVREKMNIGKSQGICI